MRKAILLLGFLLYADSVFASDCDAWKRIARMYMSQVESLRAENAQLRAGAVAPGGVGAPVAVESRPAVVDESGFLEEMRLSREQQQRQWDQAMRLRRAESLARVRQRLSRQLLSPPILMMYEPLRRQPLWRQTNCTSDGVGNINCTTF